MPSISLPPIWSLSGSGGSSSGLIGSFSLRAMAAKSVARPARVPGREERDVDVEPALALQVHLDEVGPARWRRSR